MGAELDLDIRLDSFTPPLPKVSVSVLRNPQTALDTPACRVPSVVPASATTGRAATAPQVSFSSPSSFCRGLLDKGTGLRFHLTSFWGCGQCKETGQTCFPMHIQREEDRRPKRTRKTSSRLMTTFSLCLSWNV